MAAKEKILKASKDVYVPLAAQIINLDDESADNLRAVSEAAEQESKAAEVPQEKQTPQQDRLATMRKNYEKRI